MMSTAGVIGTGLILLMCAAGCVNVSAAENCHTPSAQALIAWYNTTYPNPSLRYSLENSAVYHPIAVFQTARPRINWIGLAWLSPVWGALFAANCDGKSLAALSVGAVGKITAGPALPELGQTIMFEYVDREDTACVHDSIRIVAIHNGKIISLWNHAYKQGMNVIGAGTALERFDSTRYNVTLSKNGQTIHISGATLTYPYRKDGTQSPTPSTTKVLPAETYQWNAKILRFMPDMPYPHPRPCVRSDRPNVK